MWLPLAGALMLADSHPALRWFNDFVSKKCIHKVPLVAGTALGTQSWLQSKVWSETRSKSRPHHATRMAALAFVDVPLDHESMTHLDERRDVAKGKARLV